MQKKNIFFFFLSAIIFFGCTKQDGITPNWPKKNDFPGNGRNRAVGFTIGDKAYMGTGYNGAYQKDFWQYDSKSDSWQQKANFGGTARYAAVGFSVNSKGYIGLGFDAAYKSDFWEYDPVANAWTQKAFMSSVREFAMAFVIGNKAYVGCGTNASTELKDFWEYDPSADTWTQKKNFPGTQRKQGTAFSLGGKGYMGLGYNYYLGSVSYGDMYAYEPTTDTWSSVASFPTLRSEAASFVIGNYAYVVTGIDQTTTGNDFYKYDPSTDKWIMKEKFSGKSRSGAIGFSIGNRGYVCCGYGDGYSKDVFEYWP